ncbi:MAG TPA: Gfo/Idh/MocA family oxidoreductase [Polyangiaceae bacterium]|nr:Gfo/Idh/MocA family oxidoreductase [Polyangiaceae bacterium]
MTGESGPKPAPISRALFVGLGGIGQRHLRNLRALFGDSVAVDAFRVRREQRVLDDQLSVIADSDLDARYGVSVYSDLDAALAQGPDAVFVTNPSSMHVDVARRAAEASAHVFIEKPVSHSLEGVLELDALLRRKQRVGFVAYQLRRHPGFRKLSERLAEGAIGRVLSVRAEVGEYLPNFHPYEDYRRMYASRRDLGGGVTLSQIHELDYLIALFGKPRRAFAMGGKVSSLEVDVDDLTSGVVEFRGPRHGRVIVEVHQDFFSRPTSRRCVVVGDAGRLEWSLSERSFRRWDASATLVEQDDYAAYPRNEAFLEELRYFFDCIRERKQPDVDVRVGAESLKLALGLLESQSSGRAIEFEENTR